MPSWRQRQRQRGSVLPQANDHASTDGGLRYAFFIDEQAIAAVQIPNPPLSVRERHDDVPPTDAGVVDPDFAVFVAADVERLRKPIRPSVLAGDMEF